METSANGEDALAQQQKPYLIKDTLISTADSLILDEIGDLRKQALGTKTDLTSLRLRECFLNTKHSAGKHDVDAGLHRASDAIIAHLRLLLNPKDEVAFLKCMTTPCRGLSRALLKALLHEGVSSTQPLYSIAMSFVMQIELGGEGYRPSETSPLRPLQAGLMDLVKLLNSTAESLDESGDSSTACVQKAIRCMAKALKKAEVPVVTCRTITAATQRLMRLMDQFIVGLSQDANMVNMDVIKADSVAPQGMDAFRNNLVNGWRLKLQYFVNYYTLHQADEPLASWWQPLFSNLAVSPESNKENQPLTAAKDISPLPYARATTAVGNIVRWVSSSQSPPEAKCLPSAAADQLTKEAKTVCRAQASKRAKCKPLRAKNSQPEEVLSKKAIKAPAMKRKAKMIRQVGSCTVSCGYSVMVLRYMQIDGQKSLMQFFRK
eukprot:TRINITY_DN8776_c0_g1_i3.p1 TRINITY_DN8776_c0_g1~~TRINITY_DN8776_c0_g1_i3.p1  ORF type:complete len:434 (+),score=58.95 TRINITY_DN8776_c0_g1_i3:26-1327(+)